MSKSGSSNNRYKIGKKMKSTLDFHPKFLASLASYSKEKFTKDLMAGIIVGIVAFGYRFRYRLGRISRKRSHHRHYRRIHRLFLRWEQRANRRAYRSIYRYRVRHYTSLRIGRTGDSHFHGRFDIGLDGLLPLGNHH